MSAARNNRFNRRRCCNRWFYRGVNPGYLVLFCGASRFLVHGPQSESVIVVVCSVSPQKSLFCLFLCFSVLYYAGYILIGTLPELSIWAGFGSCLADHLATSATA